MDLWDPKHVELTNVMNKINHKRTLCILLDYMYTSRKLILEIFYFFCLVHRNILFPTLMQEYELRVFAKWGNEKDIGFKKTK
jgi:hypothetical protein